MTLRHRATHSRIRVADRSRGCTQTAIGLHFDTGRPANGLPIARTSPAHGLQKGSSPSIEQLAQPLENEDSDAYPRRRRGRIIPGTSKIVQMEGHNEVPTPIASLALSFLQNEWNFRSCAAVVVVDYRCNCLPEPIACRHNLDRTESFAG